MASAMRYKGSEASYQEIGQALGADLLLDASFLKAGGNLRFKVELHEARSEALLLKTSYEKEMSAVYSILADIVQAVGTAIAADPFIRAGDPKNVDPASFDIFLSGLHHWSRSTEADYKQAIECYIESLKGDPEFGPSYELLAACYAYLGFWGHLPLAQVYPRAKLAAEKALEINPRSVEANAALALVHWLLDWDLEAAQKALEKALEINPSHAAAHWSKGIFLGAVWQRPSEALTEMNEVRILDPLSTISDIGSGWVLYWGRKFLEAKEHFTKILEAEEEVISTWQGRGLACLGTDEFDDALIAFNRALAVSSDPYSQGLSALATGRSGDAKEARKKLGDLLERSGKEWIPSLAIAWSYLGLDEKENSIDWLAKAVEERDPQIFWLKAAALYDPLRGEAGFDELLKKIGFRAAQ
jgi:tetratricopeptide (TPR) repeat protein